MLVGRQELQWQDQNLQVSQQHLLLYSPIVNFQAETLKSSIIRGKSKFELYKQLTPELE